MKVLWLVISGWFVATTHTLQASYILHQVGAGEVTLTGETNQKNASASITTLTINRSALGYGDTSSAHASVVEGVYYTYTFTVPSLAGVADFDVQNAMGGLWSGWGDRGNGQFQNGPTSSSWSRGIRFQHRYPDDASSSFPVGHTPPVSTLDHPSVGDVLNVGVYLLGLTNDIEFVYTNVTTGQSFSYTFKFADDPSSAVPIGNLSFNNISFRSDSGITAMSYTYGTLHVVPEPSRVLLFAVGFSLFVLKRNRTRSHG